MQFSDATVSRRHFGVVFDKQVRGEMDLSAAVLDTAMVWYLTVAKCSTLLQYYGFIKLHIIAQSSPVFLVILCH